MLKKIYTIAARIIAGLFLFYLVVSLVVIPLVAPWVISSQGTQYLKHPVVVRFVSFNPFLLRLTVSGFEIQDAQKKSLVGFKSFSVDVSFLSLFKKQYRIESVKLDGLKVSAALLPGGKINLMDLVPATGPQPAATPLKESKPAAAVGAKTVSAQSAIAQPLPVVLFDDILVSQGSVRFVDQTVTPHFMTTLHDIDIHVTGLSTKPDCLAKVTFKAGLDEKGIILNETMIKPFVQPLEMETTFSLNGYAMNVLTPYTGKYTGRTLKDGNLEFRMDYRIADNKLTAGHKLLIQRFEFGQKVASKDALPLPFGLVVALLEDPQGRINISLPVTGDMSKPDFHYWPLVGQVVRNFFIGLVTKPFSFLAASLGADSGTEELGYVRFTPGQANLLDQEKEKLKLLIKGLKDHPKLSLEINGSTDPIVDWKAIKTEALGKEYKDLRAQSSRSESLVYQMIYQRHFGIRELWAVTKKYKSSTGVYDDTKLVQELKRQLVENAPADKIALEALATTRAKAVYDQMIADGFGGEHLTIGATRSTQASMGYVPLEFTLTVFGEPSDSTKIPGIESPAVGAEPKK
ncbi:MAG: DUF748 domain-containing protein [Candidatus Omnitrophica bacterium]|nr:DUF748 domain-containing protein [Candidatus Omnitrophota bacterium]